MITIQIEPADNGIVKFLIDDNVNGGGEEYTSRIVYDFDGYKGREQQAKFLKDLILDLGLATGSDVDSDKLEVKLGWGKNYEPTQTELKNKIQQLKKEVKLLEAKVER